MVAHENCYRFIDAVWPSYIQFNVYCVLYKAQCNISGFQKHIQTFIWIVLETHNVSVMFIRNNRVEMQENSRNLERGSAS